MLNALTFDVETAYHVVGARHDVTPEEYQRLAPRVITNTALVLRLLAAHRVRATFFVLGAVAEEFPNLVRQIAAAGHEIASHGFAHQPVYAMTPQAFRQDLRRSLALLHTITGRRIHGFRAASFSITRQSAWALDILRDEGLQYDASVFPIVHPRYGDPGAARFPHAIRAGLIEFPLSTVRVLGVNIPMAGGAYLRLWPLAVIRGAIRALNRAGHPVQLYLHPWEFDTTQPRLPLRWDRAFTHYHNLERTYQRCERLLQDFAFGPIREVLHLP